MIIEHGRYPTRVTKIDEQMLSTGLNRLPQVLRSLGFDSLRKGQDQVVYSLLSGQDTLCILPTGAGKSLCYAVPTLCHGWKSIVFSPLVALMRDQVQGFQRKGVAAAQISSTQTDGENTCAMKDWVDGKISLLFVAPERLENITFQEAMKTRPPDAVFNDECFTPDTEILTEDGFVRFDQLSTTARVAQFEASDESLSFVKPLAYIKKPFDGELISLKSKRYCDLLMTPGHELLVKRGSRVIKPRAEDFNPRSDLNRVFVAGRSKEPDTSLLTPFERLAIAFQADGSFHNHYVNGKNSLSFSFAKQRKIDRFMEIMNQGEFQFSEVKASVLKRRFIVRDVDKVSKLLSDTFKIAGMSSTRARAFLEEMVCWDGSVMAPSRYYYSSVIKANAEFIQTVAVLAGYKAYLTAQVDARSASFSDVHRLFIDKRKNTVGTQKWVKSYVPYTGDVYCVSVPSGNIVVRRNNKVIITGNCHCLSADGDSFRPAYKKVGDFIREYSPKVVAAFSATVTESVELDVRNILGMNNATRLRYYPRRENLILSSSNLDSEMDIVDYVKRTEGTTLIYCSTIKRLESLTGTLQALCQEPIGYYHGQLPPAMKRSTQDAFMEGKIRVMLATSAFGMGVDHATIRHVLQRDIEASIEATAQALGRGGRDGNTTHCHTYYSPDSLKTQQFFLQNKFPGPEKISSVFDCLMESADDMGRCNLSFKEISKNTGLHSMAIDPILAILTGDNVLRRSKEKDNTATIRYLTQDAIDPRFDTWKDAIYEGGIPDGNNVEVDMDWLSEKLGYTTSTTVKNWLNKWTKEGLMVFTPPQSYPPLEIVGSLGQVDFNRLAKKASEAVTKLKDVLEYCSLDDSLKHQFMEDRFGIER